MRIGDVDDLQTAREPGDGNLGAANLLTELMEPGVVSFRRAVFLLDLEAGERYRPRLVGDVDQPQERRRRGTGEAHHVLVRHQHDAAAAQQERHRQRGVRRPGKWRAPIEAGDEFRPAHILDVEDNEAAVPVAHVETVADPHRVVAAMVRSLPGRLFTAGGPLSRHPPAPDFFRAPGILKIDDRDDVAEIALDLRGSVHIAPVEGKAVHAARLPRADVARRRRPSDIEDLEAAPEIRVLSPDRIDLAIDQHDPVVDTHLVRQRSRRDLDLGQCARLLGIADIDQRGPVRRLDVTDIGHPVTHHHLTAAGTIEMTDDPEPLSAVHARLHPYKYSPS